MLSSCRSFIIITLVFKFTHSTPIHKQQCFTMPVIKPTAKDNRKPWFENRDLARRGHSCKHWFEKVPKKQHVRNRVLFFCFFEWGPKSTRTVYSLGWNKQCFHRYCGLYCLWESISTFRGTILVIIYNNSNFLNYISWFKIPLFIKHPSLCLFLLYM